MILSIQHKTTKSVNLFSFIRITITRERRCQGEWRAVERIEKLAQIWNNLFQLRQEYICELIMRVTSRNVESDKITKKKRKKNVADSVGIRFKKLLSLFDCKLILSKTTALLTSKT